MQADLEPTIEFVKPGSEHLSEGGVDYSAATGYPTIELDQAARLAIRTGSSSTDLSRRFQEATQRLLRERLIIAATTLLGMILVVFVLSALFNRPSFREYLLRTMSLVTALSVYICLRRMPSASLFVLRTLEVALFAVPIFEACTAQIFETQALLDTGQPDEVIKLHAIIQTAIAVFIAIYGMFIPARWYRTAIVTGVAAVIPTLVAMGQAYFVSELSVLGIPNFALASLLVMMSCVATLGARLVHATRKEIESARRFGQYELTEEIGRGGMGVVYRAEHRMLKRPAAIKLIQAEASFDDQAIARFETEVQLSATLSHWNTVQIYDYGRTDAGDFYYVMEHLRGETLESRIRREPLAPIKTSEIAIQICDGLSEAHAREMVHRDLKPGNIFLSDTGGLKDVVKILDFGLAVETSNSDASEQGICGSPPYMSPEQILGLAVDHRSDIYSIGCVLFECLTGKRLFQESSIKGTLQAHLNSEFDLSQLSEHCAPLKALIERCLINDVSSRIENVESLALELGKIKKDLELVAP